MKIRMKNHFFPILVLKKSMTIDSLHYYYYQMFREGIPLSATVFEGAPNVQSNIENLFTIGK